MKMITINLNEYVELINSQEELDSLEEAGVDNWCGYGERGTTTEWTEEDFVNHKNVFEE